MKFHFRNTTIMCVYILSTTFQYGYSLHEEFRSCKKVAIENAVAMNITTKILKIIPWTKIIDGFPFLFKHPKTNMTAIVCLPEKIASTTWKSLFIKVENYLNPLYIHKLKIYSRH